MIVADAVQEAREYMAWRALSLLLVDGRPLTRSAAGEFSARASERPGARRPATLAEVVALLTAWRAGAELAREILPLFTVVDRRPAAGLAGDDSACQVLDWNATFDRWEGDDARDEVVMRVASSAPDECVARLLKVVLLEFATHCDLLVGEAEGTRTSWPETLHPVVARVRAVARQCRTRLAAADLDAVASESAFVDAVRRRFRAALEAPVEGASRWSYASPWEEIAKPLAPRRGTQAIARLWEWHDAYVRGPLFLERVAGADVLAGAAPGLYELWCFAELLNSFEGGEAAAVSMRSFLRAGSVEPQAQAGGGYAYFDYRRRVFEGVARAAGVAPSAAESVALPAAHVEWFLRGPGDYRDSLVLDTKFYPGRSWDSGEALKVLGYMLNFGVRNGAIVFAGTLDPLVGKLPSDVPGLYRTTCPGPDRATMWILSMRPASEHEAANQTVMRAFVQALRGRGVLLDRS